eukprot:scaffold47474_cov55-Phaeocystis_antarctica.AAC.3
MQHVPQLQALVARRRGQTRRAGGQQQSGPPTARGALAAGHGSPLGLQSSAWAAWAPRCRRPGAPPRRRPTRRFHWPRRRLRCVMPSRCGCSA